MKTLFFQCTMGAAGDMLMASLLELLDKPQEFIDKLNSLNIPKVKFDLKKAEKCGIVGTNVVVSIDGEVEGDDSMHNYTHHYHHSHGGHHHSKLSDIEEIIDILEISDKVKEDAKNVYKIIARAESEVHGKEIGDIHFHEVGTFDAVADIVGVCMLIEEIAPDKIISSPICLGNGHVHCAHGILPVPAPATALILKGVPVYAGSIEGELCTPTGAALLAYFADEFASMPCMTLEKTGYGMGKKDFKAANCVRCMLGEADENAQSVVELCCNLDDMTGEAVGYAMEVLIDNGALDVYTTPIGMKKNRPAVMLTCMCKYTDKNKFISLIFKHTTTIGIRQYECGRYVLERENFKKNTKFGSVNYKRSKGYGVIREKAEYEDIRRIAAEKGCSLAEVINGIEER